jgi:hypothetical protein
MAALSLLSGSNATRAATPAASELPTVQFVLDRFVRVTGGRDAWMRHRSITIHGRYQVPARNLDVETVSHMKDGKAMQIALLAAGKSLSGYDGHTAWDLDADGKVFIHAGDEVRSIARDADMYYHLHVMDYFQSMEVVDVQEFSGHSCYHLKGVNSWGKVNEQFYDRQSGLLIGYAFNTAWRGGNGAATAIFENYRDFGGVLMPAKTVTRDGDSLSIFSITLISYDDVDDSIFALPQPVRERLLATRLTSAPPEDLLRFKPSDRPTPCPTPVHPKNGSLAVTGTNLDSRAIWTQFKRTAFLGENGAGVPGGCIAVSTIGALISAKGLLHFKGEGHYCPQTDKAVYHYVFDATEAERFGMPERGTIDYDGGKNIETYSSSMS